MKLTAQYKMATHFSAIRRSVEKYHEAKKIGICPSCQKRKARTIRHGKTLVTCTVCRRKDNKGMKTRKKSKKWKYQNAK